MQVVFAQDLVGDQQDSEQTTRTTLPNYNVPVIKLLSRGLAMLFLENSQFTPVVFNYIAFISSKWHRLIGRRTK